MAGDMSTAVLVACTGGWRFRLKGSTVVDLLGDSDHIVGSMRVDRVRLGQRVAHMGQPHRLVEIVTGAASRLAKGRSWA